MRGIIFGDVKQARPVALQLLEGGAHGVHAVAAFLAVLELKREAVVTLPPLAEAPAAMAPALKHVLVVFGTMALVVLPQLTHAVKQVQAQ